MSRFSDLVRLSEPKSATIVQIQITFLTLIRLVFGHSILAFLPKVSKYLSDSQHKEWKDSRSTLNVQSATS